MLCIQYKYILVVQVVNFLFWFQGGDNYGYDSSPPGRGRGRGMGAPRRFFRRSGGFRGSRGTGGPPRRPYQDDNQVK